MPAALRFAARTLIACPILLSGTALVACAYAYAVVYALRHGTSRA